MNVQGEDAKVNDKLEVATFGGGCFWCTEAVFADLKGVVSVVPGYAGGDVINPAYEQVCSGETGHAEVIQVQFDPAQISYNDLLAVFFATHDPTQLNRQGPDSGTQYRSAIFYHDAEQKKVAEEVISELRAAGVWRHPIVTEVVPLEPFYPAEDYHQDYYKKNVRHYQRYRRGCGRDRRLQELWGKSDH